MVSRMRFLPTAAIQTIAARIAHPAPQHSIHSHARRQAGGLPADPRPPRFPMVEALHGLLAADVIAAILSAPSV